MLNSFVSSSVLFIFMLSLNSRSGQGLSDPTRSEGQVGLGLHLSFFGHFFPSPSTGILGISGSSVDS